MFFGKEPEEHYEVIVKTLTGSSLEFKVTDQTSVMDLLLMIQDKAGMPPQKNRMIRCGKHCELGKLLTDYDLSRSEPSIFHLVLSLKGGPTNNTNN